MKTKLHIINQSNFSKFSQFVKQHSQELTPRCFSEQFGYLENDFLHNGELDNFCINSKILIEESIKEKRKDLASIIISSLCKIVGLPDGKLEEFAKIGLQIASDNNDTIHMMGRLEDLRRLYFGKNNYFKQYLNTLFQEEKCLQHIIDNYREIRDNNKTIFRTIKPIISYKKMLAFIQIDIAKLTKNYHPKEAEQRLLSAKELLIGTNNAKTYKYIDMLLDKISNSNIEVLA